MGGSRGLHPPGHSAGSGSLELHRRAGGRGEGAESWVIFMSRTMKRSPSNCKVAHQQSGEAGLGGLCSLPACQTPLPPPPPPRWDRDGDKPVVTCGRERSARPTEATVGSRCGGVGRRRFWGCWAPCSQLRCSLCPCGTVLWILNLQKRPCVYLAVNSRDMRAITPKQRRYIDLTAAIHVCEAKHECNCSRDLGRGELAPA